MEVKLTLTTYRVELEHKVNTEAEDPKDEFYLSPKINSINKEKDLISIEEFNLSSEEVNVQLKIQELSEKAKSFNSLQLKMAKSLKKLEINFKIVTTVK